MTMTLGERVQNSLAHHGPVCINIQLTSFRLLFILEFKSFDFKNLSRSMIVSLFLTIRDKLLALEQSLHGFAVFPQPHLLGPKYDISFDFI